jgi:hypothetical protein
MHHVYGVASWTTPCGPDCAAYPEEKIKGQTSLRCIPWPNTLTDQDALCYWNNYPDLNAKTNSINIPLAKQHWVQYGKNEKRNWRCPDSSPDTLTDAEAQCYLNNYVDLQNALGTTNVANAKQHWVQNGKSEKRNWRCQQDPFPDTITDQEAQCYLNSYEDLRQAFGATNVAGAKLHWAQNGKNELRNWRCPGQFPVMDCWQPDYYGFPRWCGNDYSDTGLCCRKGFMDKYNGCDGTYGGEGKHVCVTTVRDSAPKCTNDTRVGTTPTPTPLSKTPPPKTPPPTDDNSATDDNKFTSPWAIVCYILAGLFTGGGVTWKFFFNGNCEFCSPKYTVNNTYIVTPPPSPRRV